jgi:hypothetical protein
MLEVGNMPNFNEDRAHFGLWCVTSSPLVLGFDLTDDAVMDKAWRVISNREAIAVNQGWAGHPGTLVKNVTTSNKQPAELWAKPVTNDAGTFSVAVMVLNIGATDPNTAEPLLGSSTVAFDLGLLSAIPQFQPAFALAGKSLGVRDLWARKDLPPARAAASFTTDAFAAHDSRLFLFTATAADDDAVVGALVEGVGTGGAWRAGAVACAQQCLEAGHCCGGAGSTECNGGAGRQGYPTPQQPTLSCYMGCTVAAHSASAVECKETCLRSHWGPDACSFDFQSKVAGGVNVTFNKCGGCPETCKADEYSGRFVGDGECEQACDFTFGCPAPGGSQQ